MLNMTFKNLNNTHTYTAGHDPAEQHAESKRAGFFTCACLGMSSCVFTLCFYVVFLRCVFTRNHMFRNAVLSLTYPLLRANKIRKDNQTISKLLKRLANMNLNGFNYMDGVLSVASLVQSSAVTCSKNHPTENDAKLLTIIRLEGSAECLQLLEC